MGATKPKSQLDQEYRELVARFLAKVWRDNKYTSQTQIAEAMGVNRSTASRYLSKDTRAPLPRLMRIERALQIKVPQEIIDAYWASEEGDLPINFEAQIREVAADLQGKSPEEQAAFLEELRRALAKAS